ncbi:MAG: LacI family DNA-binding transcriptional regulator [Thermotogota bacterium]|nr:LacI family DNA-binding transcriptional regulator [Thermotogota bacterium]
MKKVTMSDIAKKTGFSIKTVSRVINNSPEVKPATKRKILDAIEETNFSVNLMAKALKNQQTKTVILFIDRHGGSYWNAWHSLIILNIITDFKVRGYKVILSPSSAQGVIDDDTDGFILLKGGIADGAVLFDNLKGDIRIKYLRENNIPFVILGKDFDYKDTCYVDLDNFHVGEIGARHLIERGYKCISFFLGNQEFYVNKSRVDGFKKICATHDIKFHIEYAVNNLQDAYDYTKIHLQKFQSDAFFVSGDEKITAAYKGIKEAKKKIPEEVGVLGIDNLPQSQYLDPSLSSIDQNVERFAQTVVNSLIETMHSEKRTPKGILIKPVLEVRDSTG